MDNKRKTVHFEMDPFDIINMYFEEWKYRHENFWKRLIQFSVITFFTTTLPITFRVFGEIQLPDIPIIFFPLAGGILTVLTLIFCLSENSRMMAVGNTINELIRDYYGESFLRKPLPATRFSKIYKLRIGIWIPSLISLLQFSLVVLMVLIS